MKVLGKGDVTLICEVSIEELKEIIGSDDYGFEYFDNLSTGDTIDLERAIKAAKWIRNLDGKHINTVIKDLQMALVGVEKVKTSATALNLFNKLAEDPNEPAE